MAKTSDKNTIKQGGVMNVGGRPNDIKIGVPNLWYPDIQSFQRAVTNAIRWDYPSRKELYDLYDSCLMDTHLKGVVRKRKIAVSKFPIEFRRDGEPVEEVNEHIKSPWFRNFLKSLIDVQLWGFSAYQFVADKDGWIEVTDIDHRHVNPVTREVLEYANDYEGKPLADFPNTLFLGKPTDCGELMSVVPWIITKRQTTGDWAQYAQVFGMPIREYTYDGSDWETMKTLKEDAECQGSNGIYFHTTDTSMNIIEPGNRSGSADLYERLMDKCDEQISIMLLGNTLTTTVGDSGSRALGDVQKSEEESIMEDDRGFVLDVLNYEMSPIFAALGIDTEGGEWVYAEKEKIDKTQQADIVVKMNSIGLPISDDYLYDTFGIAKPDDYDQIKADKEAQRKALEEALRKQSEEPEPGNDPAENPKTTDRSIYQRILDFFAEARAAGTRSERW
ncbi:MAG: DUF935 domain-containing protein [Bacteroidales bacterium]|nr:DUF935 domain-containing protein [Bacteroidales bacterium]